MSPASNGVLIVCDPRKPGRPRQADGQAERLATRLLARDATYAAKVTQVRRYQARLRGQLSARSWRLYLLLEEAEVGRWTYALERVANFAVTSRKRSRRR